MLAGRFEGVAQQPARSRVRGAVGFTLIELMIVVVIVAILAVVAVTSYSRYKRNARRSDALALMNDIRIKQETFFNTYSRYVSAPDADDETQFTGTPVSGDNLHGYYQWDAECPGASPWCMLGFRPRGETIGSNDNLLYFQLQTISWAPGATAPSFVNDTSGRWWSVQARGLPDDQDKFCTLLRLTSDSREAMIFGEHDDCP